MSDQVNNDAPVQVTRQAPPKTMSDRSLATGGGFMAFFAMLALFFFAFGKDENKAKEAAPQPSTPNVS